MNPYQDPYVWLFATSAVFIVSLCGLLSVAVIPFMQKWFYHTLLQLLIGLAIGSLSADGILHLMPHAILDDERSYINHEISTSSQPLKSTAIWRSLTTLCGIFIFYVVERLFAVLSVYRRQRKDLKKEDGVNSTDADEKIAQSDKSSYNHAAEGDGKEHIQIIDIETTVTRKVTVQPNHEVAFHGRSNFRIENDASILHHPDSENCVIVSDHHGHNHGHEMPYSVSSVAWMVIMGDGLHNFCDGLAIGTAFASSPGDGFSTSLAVFCHELPHELGDFAMLLKTGMTEKQALCYNSFSSILCFLGMIIGVFLGNVDSATNWVFAFTAGMFLYIAFVDMLPELSSENNSGVVAEVNVLIVQVAGISIGISIMLLIALYEDRFSSVIS